MTKPEKVHSSCNYFGLILTSCTWTYLEDINFHCQNNPRKHDTNCSVLSMTWGLYATFRLLTVVKKKKYKNMFFTETSTYHSRRFFCPCSASQSQVKVLLLSPSFAWFNDETLTWNLVGRSARNSTKTYQRDIFRHFRKTQKEKKTA